MNKKITTSLVASFVLATNIYSAETFQLDEITVTSATKSTQSIKDVTSNIDVITSEELEERNFTTVSEALNTLGGINVISNGGLGKSSTLKVRGFDSERVLVLIDGIRYNDITGLSGAPFEHLIISDINQIEVIKGSQSGIWGADASAGVINIITSNSKKGFHGSINTEAGSYGTKKYGTSLSYGTNDYYLKANIQKLTTDGYTARAPKGSDIDDFEDDKYQNTTGSIKAGFNFNEENKIDFSHTVINAKGDLDSSFGGTVSDQANDDSNSNKIRDTFSTVSYQNKNSIATTDVFVKRSLFDRSYNTSEYDGSVNEYGIKTVVPYFNKESFVVLGGDYKEFKHKNSIQEEYKNKAGFITNRNKFNNTVFTQSLRYDRYDKFENKLTGKIGLKQFFTRDFNGSINYGTGYNVPTLYNLYSFYGNENLTPENTKSFDISLGYKNFKITYFDNKVKDMIDYDFTISKYGNIAGESKLKGYELSYKQNISDDTLFSTNYTHLSAKNSDGEELARRAKRQLGFAIDYYGVDKLHLNINGTYLGSMYNSDNKQGVKTGNYTVWNSVVNYEINKTFSTYLKVDNLFNKYYQNINNYATAERSAYVGLKATF